MSVSSARRSHAVSSPRFGVSTHLYPRPAARPRAPGRDCRARLRVRRGVRHPHALRLPRQRRRALAGRVARRHAADAELDARADLAPASSTASGARRSRTRSLDDERRRKALAEAEAALAVAQTIPFRTWSCTSACPMCEAGAGRQQPRRRAAKRRGAARDGRARRRAARARSDSQRAVERGIAGVVHRKRPRGRERRHLHGRRPRAS